MNYTADQRRKLWGILVSLALVITVAIVLDCLPVNQDLPADVLDNTTSVTDPSDVTSDDIDSPDKADPSQTDDTTQTTESQDTQEIDTPGTEPVVEDTSFVLTFLGECSPGSPLGTSSFGSLNALTNEKGVGYYFSQLQSVISADDLTVGANTCIFTDNNTPSDIIECTAPAANTAIYTAGSVEFLSLAAPELSEYSDNALADTVSALNSSSIQHAGDGQITYFENANIRLAIVCLQLTKNLNTADDIALIHEAKESAEFVAVYFWGGDNGSHIPEEWLTATLRSFADAGAALVVGCGNGVLRPVEQYGSSTIAYSLGTLLDGAALYHQNATALLQLTLTKNSAGELMSEIQLIPCYVYKELWQPCLISDSSDSHSITAFLQGELSSPTQE